MVDKLKRRTLISMGGLMAIPLVPGMSFAMQQPAALSNGETTDSVIDLEQVNSDLHITLHFDNDQPEMSITNTSDKLAIVRRIHPGIVHVGEKTYDLNAALINSAYAIGAGMTRSIHIGEALSTAAEPALAARYSKKPLQVCSVVCNDTQGRVLNTSRSFFS